MHSEEVLKTLPGAENLFSWFGYWPSFHDAEVISLELHRTGISRLKVHTFAMTEEIDPRGHYINEKHVIVTFLLEKIEKADLSGFNHQNVLWELAFERSPAGVKLLLAGCYGVEGDLFAERVSVELEPGIPAGSVYEGTKS